LYYNFLKYYWQRFICV